MSEFKKIIEFHSNGSIKRKGMIKNGNRTGTWFAWHSNGQKAKEINYHDGNPVGKWTLWRENVEINRTGAFETKGDKLGNWSWHQRNGQIITKNS
ncbi:MAG: hypothetical protein HN548_11205 [Opitutae bacterium]|nr:hypothetical protein [Opitutae bacterium]